MTLQIINLAGGPDLPGADNLFTAFTKANANFLTLQGQVTTPGGSNKQLQYNSSGSFAGIAGSTWDGTTLTVPNLTSSNQVLSTGGGLLGGNNSHPGLSFAASSTFGFDYDTVRTAVGYVEFGSIYAGFSASGLSVQVGGMFAWAGGADALGSLGAGLSALGTGIVAVGNGTQGDTSGTLKTAFLNLTATSGSQITGPNGIILVVQSGTGYAVIAGNDGVRRASIGQGQLQLTANTPLTWSSNANGPTDLGIDTGISRVSAGVIAIGSGAQGNTSGTLQLANGVFSRNGIGVTPTDGLVLQNTTSAAAGAQQNSPRLHLIAQGWSTNSGGASMTVDWTVDSRPVQGTTNPAALLQFSAQINNTGYMPVISLGANTAANDGSQINFLGNSIGGTSSGTGFAFALGYNAVNNKQIWFGDPDYFGNSSANFVRIITTTGTSTIDCVAGDNGSTNPLCLSGNGGGVIVGGTQPTSPSSTMWVDGNLTIGTSESSQAAPTSGLFVKGGAVMASGALATNATAGFLYIPTCAGAPTGTPTSYTGTVAMVYDTTDNKLYIYNAAWKGGTAPGVWS